MQYNLWFNVCAMIMLTALLALYYMRFKAPFKKYLIFLLLLWCVMISTIASICNNTLPGIAPIWVIYVSNTVYFLAHGLITPLLFLYVYSLTDYNLQDYKHLIPWLLPSCFAVLMQLTNWFSNTIFWLDAGGGYHRGPLLPLLYLVTVINFFAILFVLLRRRTIAMRERVSICIFLLLASGAMLFQLIFPTMLVENFVCAICLMISQLTVQNTETILDNATGMLTKQGFSSLLAPQFEKERSFHIGFLMIDNYHELEKNYGFSHLEKGLMVIADYLKTHMEFTFARLDNSTFCFVEKGFRSGLLWDNMLQDLSGEKLLPHLRRMDVGLRFRIKTGVLDCPTDIQSFSSLMELLGFASKLPLPSDQDDLRLNTDDVLNLRRRKQLDELVHRAVSDRMLYVVYQPVYSIAEKRFCSAEALLRMHTDKLGDVSPAEFIRAAEENGVITEMTQFVVDSICSFIQSSHWRELHLSRIHVNLSIMDCMQDKLAARILETLEHRGVAPNTLSIEITETAFSAIPDSMLDNFTTLSRAGISILLDDYGTGYSNLSRLLKIPFDIVKLDKSLVDNILSESARIILDNTIQMLKGLNKKILAEGVETKTQADYLISRGCDYIQGYYYAKPMDAFRLESLIRSQSKPS